MTVAQQFTAGISDSQTLSPWSGRLKNHQEIDNCSRPFHGLPNDITSLPSDESLGYYHSSAIADWEFALFGQSYSTFTLVGFDAGKLKLVLW